MGDKNIYNWATDNTHKSKTILARERLDAYKASRKGKKYQLVKVSDRPLTYKEIEIK